MKKTGYHSITGTIHLLSGMRIGGSDDQLEIGGTDLTCIKHPVTKQPYIPGSSLKGKMRSELEAKLEKFGGNGNEPCGCGNCIICRVFGMHKPKAHNLGPTRILVRDSALLTGGETELKAENVIDRKTGTAMHPRKFERVVSGSEFSLKIGIQVWDMDGSCSHNGKIGDDALIEFVKEGLRLVQRTGLGSGVSKGSGEVEFRDLKLDGQPFQL
ncbi:MAG: type III-A CRISPR-associated RAMP protein Csm3 [Planctomycetes bacterium]|nr:type III-A CRISPR-associated RAMP protein Csm3 [Planctomycetota bacterium]